MPIRKSRVFMIIAGVATAAIAAAALGKEPMTEDDLKMIPEPTLGSVMSGKYEFDRQATRAHYDDLFQGKTAEEIVRFLEDRGIVVIYDTPDRISFFVERRLMMIEYSALVALYFKDGTFLRSDVTGSGVL